jgi:transcription elongation factor SPT5
VYTAIAQQSLLPSVSDPNLWMVSCSTGKEQELVYQIMNKCVAHARMGRPLGISAAIAAQSKGRIYVESFHEPSVLEAIQNVRGILFSTLRLVPIGDMTTVLTVTPAKKPVQKNDWVRMTRGHYKGDLALVRAVKESGLKCIVQCVPRLDYALADLSPEEARIRRRTVRPPQKFFNAQEVASLGRQTLRRQRFPGLDVYCDYFEGNYYHDGYLLKEMTVGGMVKPLSEDDPPTLDELAKFQRRGRTANHSKDKDVGSGGFDDGDDGLGGGGGAADEDENEGSRLAASLLDELSELQGRVGLAGSSSFSSGGAGGGAAGLIIGDTVEVVEGDLVGMRGKIVSLDETTVKIRPLSVDLGAGMVDEVEFLASQVRKHIEVGAHVKVIDGRYANETGVVVAVEKLDGGGEAGGSVLSAADFTAIILTDVTSKEISVRISQVRESAEVASGQDKLQGYELYDLVVLSGGGSANEVGVIVRVGREDFTVLNNHGIAREVRPEELRGKRNSTSSRAVALDVSGNQMRCGDTVNVAEGPHKGKTATIKRMSRAQLFLHSQTRTEHAGIFVVRSRSCLLAGTRTQNRGGGGSANDGGVSPFSTPLSQSRGGPPVAAARGKRDDGLVGKTVRIQAGQWKGYVGTVTDSTATHVQVELHSRLKKVMVVRERVAVVGDKFGATEPMDAAAAAAMGSSVPMMMAAAATPMHVAVGGATPAIHGFGGATPMHDPDNSDEVWRPGGSIDQENVKEEGWGASPGDSPADSKLHFKDRDVDDESTVGGNGDGWGANGGSSDWGAPPPAVKKDEPAKQEAESAGTTGAGSASRASSLTGPGSRRDPRVGDLKHHHHPDLSDAAEDTPAWFMERVCVLVKGVGGGREGDAVSSGVIKEINTDKSALIELEDKTTTTARYHELSMIPPKEHDTVLVTGGNEIGLEGSLVCVDGTERHWSLDANMNALLLPLLSLSCFCHLTALRVSLFFLVSSLSFQFGRHGRYPQGCERRVQDYRLYSPGENLCRLVMSS